MRTRITAVCLSIAAILAVGAAGAGAASLPSLLTGRGSGHQFAGRPAQIFYTGDGSAVLGGFDGSGASHPGHLRWSKWTRREALGSGAVWIDNCIPNCAEGTLSPHAVTVDAFAPRRGHFTRLTLRYRFEGKAIVDRRAIVKAGRFYIYSIVGVP
jgi:hypothetical protein